MQPKDADAHANLGAAYARLKRSDEAIRELEMALDLKPDDYEAQLSLGFAYKQQGDYKHAIEHLQKATELKPDNPQGWTNLGVAKSKTDDKEGAIVALKKAIALKPDDADLHFDLGVVYRRQRNTDAAIAEYQIAVQKNPKYAKAYYDLGIMYSLERKNPEARAAFEKYLEYGSHEDAGPRKDAEERLKTFKGTAASSAASSSLRPGAHAHVRTNAHLTTPRPDAQSPLTPNRPSRSVTCGILRSPPNHRSPPHVAFAGAWSATTSTADHAPAKAPSGGSRGFEPRR